MSRRVLVTDADQFVGPAAVERFRAGGDDVIAATESLVSREATRSQLLASGTTGAAVRPRSVVA